MMRGTAGLKTWLMGLAVCLFVATGPSATADGTEFPEWVLEPGPWADVFDGVLFPEMQAPESYRIQDVQHRRPGSSEPREPASVQMILDFHGVPYDEGLADRISVRERYPDRFIAPRDLINALQGIPVEIEFIQSYDPWADRHEDIWPTALKIIRAAITVDLPVLIGYRPHAEIYTPEFTAVAVGYDRRNIHLLEPLGNRQPVRYDLREFKYMFTYAMIILPVFDPAVDLPVEMMRVAPAFLNEISSAILNLPQFDPVLLTRRLQQLGYDAVLQDVNRADFRQRLGRTRSFARQGGLPLLDVLLDSGRIAVIPVEFNLRHSGFALIHGRVENQFSVVYFYRDRTFDRLLVSRGELARRWLNRTSRTYRLDVIHVPAEQSEPVSGIDS